MKSVAVSHSIYLLETKFPVLLRTDTRLLHFGARQRKAKKPRKNQKLADFS
ncbi:hypothetical protein [Pilibacter termitis]|uniref:hypothetical protein n=1 Tax=Pilibacter termitis TaxID=263852 RepID=UPI0013563642|nr:hypothetical protein [Pilibacter termitis]